MQSRRRKLLFKEERLQRIRIRGGWRSSASDCSCFYVSSNSVSSEWWTERCRYGKKPGIKTRKPNKTAHTHRSAHQWVSSAITGADDSHSKQCECSIWWDNAAEVRVVLLCTESDRGKAEKKPVRKEKEAQLSYTVAERQRVAIEEHRVCLIYAAE